MENIIEVMEEVTIGDVVLEPGDRFVIVENTMTAKEVATMLHSYMTNSVFNRVKSVGNDASFIVEKPLGDGESKKFEIKVLEK